MNIDWETEINAIETPDEKLCRVITEVADAVKAVIHAIVDAGRVLMNFAFEYAALTLGIDVMRFLSDQRKSRDRRLHPRAYRGIKQYKKQSTITAT